MEISHPRRILAVSKPESGLDDFAKRELARSIRAQYLTSNAGLTGSTPTLVGESIAGVTHNFHIKTTYYTAEVPIWLDEITSPSTWSAEFLAPEAREVLSVLGAFVVCFRKPVDEAGLEEIRDLLKNVADVVRDGCGYSWDGVCLAVGMQQTTTPYLDKSFEEWEDLCQDFGFEFVDLEAKGRNEFSGECTRSPREDV